MLLTQHLKSTLNAVSELSVSPDFAGLRADHGLTGFAGEGLLELREIRHDAVDSILAGRVRIGDGADTEIFRAVILAGPLRIADEEALVGSEAVFRFQAHSGRLLFPSEVGEEGATEVCNVFAAGEFGVDVDVVDDDVVRVLIALAVDAIFKAPGVGWCPPVAQIALSVELATFIIEPVR